MQRYFVKPEQMTETKVEITGEDVKHIARVMRMSQGDEIICCNNQGRVCKVEIASISDQAVHTNILEEITTNTELPINVTIVQGLPKGDKLDVIVQKGTELGASMFIPFQSERAIVKWDRKKQEKKIERLEKIAKEAAEQSYRAKIPYITPSMSVEDIIQKTESYTTKMIAYEEVAKKPDEPSQLYKLLNHTNRGDSFVCVIGPEGGLTTKEVTKLTDAGFIPCSLGPRIVRTETAAMYVLSAVSYHFEIM
ncbi:16S rRNA (uracil(1498)-N(3))-methyltransferase [Alkalihalobacillus sp. LMS39]|uniref:16S rRNA (uracil(1498)-N(3))-methyltransferase n=1 Tax=Alkalihalobacillus sp. LMS39 TaxID=2924032 RepID=UPI001FB4D5BD|nr:16S rRNA (uracil(1498)-N(3))-methyltransferase [Alkalihalobacillus sp. LMS39]UOE95643.1 16S rRNA (uracil(1498)-N(3))-methyltransferase [Alkalihalobacillus sp. LMS39]